MSKFQKFNDDEEIAIDVVNSKDALNIILRNPKNEDIKYTLNQGRIKLVKEMRNEVRLYKFYYLLIQIQISNILKLTEDKAIKMFFKGKPFKDENMISEFSKNYNLKRIEQR